MSVHVQELEKHGRPPRSRDTTTCPSGFERGVAGRWAVRALCNLPCALVALALLLAGSAVLAGVWYVTTHLLYLVHVTLVLRGITRRRPVEDLAAREDEWRRFRRRVSLMMDNDAMAFVTLGLLTRATLGIEGPAWPALVLGGVLIAAGLGTKAWATASLPAGAYYWRNFFFPDERCRISRTGPYRWLSDPMYSVGYAHLYGVALCLSSLPGLVAAAGAHLLVLLLAVLVERRAFVPPPSRPRGRT